MTIQQPSATFSSIRDFALFRLCGDLDAIHTEISGVLENNDIEYVHRIRIAIRRYRNNLRIFRYFSDQSFYDFLEQKYIETNEFSSILAFARDLDIQYAILDQGLGIPPTTGKTKILTDIKKKREIVQRQLVEYMDSPSYTVLLDHTNQINLSFSSITVFAGKDAILNAIKSSLAFTLSVLYPITPYTNSEEIHHYRKAIRRLRYTLESFQPVIPFLIENEIELTHTIQDLLGDMHDLDMISQSITAIDTLENDEQKVILEIINKNHEILNVQFIEKIKSNEMVQLLFQILDSIS